MMQLTVFHIARLRALFQLQPSALFVCFVNIQISRRVLLWPNQIINSSVPGGARKKCSYVPFFIIILKINSEYIEAVSGLHEKMAVCCIRLTFIIQSGQETKGEDKANE